MLVLKYSYSVVEVTGAVVLFGHIQQKTFWISPAATVDPGDHLGTHANPQGSIATGDRCRIEGSKDRQRANDTNTYNQAHA